MNDILQYIILNVFAFTAALIICGLAAPSAFGFAAGYCVGAAIVHWGRH